MTLSPVKTALVIGATSRIGQACISQLLRQNYNVTYTVARKWTHPFKARHTSQLTEVKLNLENINDFKIERWIEGYDLAILIPPIYLSQKLLPFAKASGVKRLVFISSYNTYRFGDTYAYAPLKAAEKAIMSSPLDTHIIQPTMIIGHAQSSACRVILNKAKNGKPLYMIKGHPALQQPIDFRDLAAAIIHAGTHAALSTGLHPVAGQTVIASQDLYQNISQLIGKSARFRILPRFIASPVIKTISALQPKVPLTAYLSRMGQDRHCVHNMLPGWSPQYSLKNSLENLSQELHEQA